MKTFFLTQQPLQHDLRLLHHIVEFESLDLLLGLLVVPHDGVSGSSDALAPSFIEEPLIQDSFLQPRGRE